MNDALPILLLMVAAGAAWLAGLGTAAGASTSTSTSAEPVKIDKIGGDIIQPGNEGTVGQLRTLLGDIAQRGGVFDFQSPDFSLAVDTPANPVVYPLPGTSGESGFSAVADTRGDFVPNSAGYLGRRAGGNGLVAFLDTTTPKVYLVAENKFPTLPAVGYSIPGQLVLKSPFPWWATADGKLEYHEIADPDRAWWDVVYYASLYTPINIIAKPTT